MILPTDKPSLRILARTLRAEAAAGLTQAGAMLAAHAPSLAVTPGTVVAGYWPMADEIDPRPLMAALAGLGSVLCLPCVEAKAQPLVFRSWQSGQALAAGPHGTLHPAPQAALMVPDLVLVPLLAFDGALHRLGYGGGYYDRTLARLRGQGRVRAVGLAFSAQRLDRLPAEADDQRLDGVLTEMGPIWAEA